MLQSYLLHYKKIPICLYSLQIQLLNRIEEVAENEKGSNKSQ